MGAMLVALWASASCLIVGADISDLQLYEDAKAVFQDSSGKTVDPLPWMKSKGLEYGRVRIFVNPTEGSETGQSTKYVSALGKRIKNEGLKFMLDFHYSDSWADPGKQTKPAAWRSLSTAALIAEVYTYTKETLQTLKSDGVTPDSIQIGNEITAGMLWDTGRIGTSGTWDTTAQWTNFLDMLKNGVKAAREVFPSAKIIIHSDRSGDATSATRFFQHLKDAALDYDIIGLSYYPMWHGSLSTMSSTVRTLDSQFGKEVWIVEVAYCYDAAGDSSGKGSWPTTPDGQATFLHEFIAAVKATPATAFFWWFPEETYSPSKRVSEDLYRGLWSNKNGKALPAWDEMASGK